MIYIIITIVILICGYLFFHYQFKGEINAYHWYKQQLNELSLKNLSLSSENEQLIDKIREAKTTLINCQDGIVKIQEKKFNSEKEVKDFMEQCSKAKEHCQEQYLDILSYEKDKYLQICDNTNKEIDNLLTTLDDLKNKVRAAIQDRLREEEKKNKINFYKLHLVQDDINDIEILRQLNSKLNNKEILNKVIWKTYFEKPTSLLIAKVVGENKTGIYKITNISNGKVYIGQAVDIGARWKQHIKRGIGAEAPLKNKLYPEMAEYGVENFTFEILEECSRDKLNELEKFWIDFYDSKNLGLNVTGGNNG